MKGELYGKTMTKCVGLRAKYSYLVDDYSEDKKAKETKLYVIERKLKFGDNFNNCLEATYLENKINYLGMNKIDIKSFEKDHKEFIKNNKLILKTEERFKS